MRPAVPGDFSVIVELIEGAAAWLADMRTDQWQRPWPDLESRDARVMAGLTEGITWLVEHQGRAVATVTITARPYRELWVGHEPDAPALYLHRLVVHRDFAGQGLGAEILDWAANEAVRRGLDWVRIDVWRTNERLHKYYQREGFEPVGTAPLPDYPSSALFQRKAVVTLDTPRRLCGHYIR
ncbi:GNAT family N-acetyltransferase [Nonomuraea sp. NPDC046570]|uniref:GNAT family N-acetyltransferase n=1 Tax=Nonomuraea sp. NPDC046570 TaxID=3155255 RepID=UPI0033D70136